MQILSVHEAEHTLHDKLLFFPFIHLFWMLAINSHGIIFTKFAEHVLHVLRVRHLHLGSTEHRLQLVAQPAELETPLLLGPRRSSVAIQHVVKSSPAARTAGGERPPVLGVL